jgi:acyl-CoA synthetase (AMP-forming)/AMP-acid ligase II
MTVGDRTSFIPAHLGENVLPNLPFFHRLLRYAQRSISPVAIRDLNAGIEKTYRHLLCDVLSFRKVLEAGLSHDARSDLAADKEVYIGLIAPGGYEYTVGFIAILAIGGAVVPMGRSRSPTWIYDAKANSCLIARRRGIVLFAQSTMRGLGN